MCIRDSIESCISHDNGIHNGILIILEMILFQEGKTLSRSCLLYTSPEDLHPTGIILPDSFRQNWPPMEYRSSAVLRGEFIQQPIPEHWKVEVRLMQ